MHIYNNVAIWISIIDDELNLMMGDGFSSLLDNSAARHKLSVKPKRNHLSAASQLRRSVSPQPAAPTRSANDDADVQIASSCQLGQILKSASEANDKYVLSIYHHIYFRF